ncbi:tripartite motif-containing protein 16-like [Sinocyclocheilus grahami]|uniref:tripartite motif-containing protein 16-like n=1 Tax=Sinocyclocheilus grahami TaxID=75366 RepID=UPI0007AD56B0|nr:PREDICTED: tripartite motif-containing protein 16-like [Sinocyclocheilus grahami]
MAEARFSHDQFRCPVCLELLKDPVTIPCGHSYCRGCITGHWNQEDQIRFYSCPECRQTFRPRPVLKKSTMLAEVVEQLKKSKLQTAVPAGPGDVECDVCTERKNKAIKSCLVCLNSFCQNHLEQHENLFKGKRHDLIDATGRLQEMICHQHEKLLDIYCQTDKQCICMACMVDEHKSHETVSAAAERTEKQRQLDETRREFQQQIQEREQKLQELKKAVKTHKRSAQTAVEDSERIFTELISSIERRRSEVTQMIRDREKTVVSRAEALMKRLTQDIGQLRRSDAELQQLSQTHNHTYFLQSFPSLPVPPGSPDVPSITDSSLDVVGKSVAKLRQKLEDFCREEIEKLSGRVTCIQIIPTPEYESRKDFLQYFFQFTLDPNTAHQRLFLSQENRVVTYNDTVQEYPNHPERFSYWWQVLCRESVSGRCYWEVEWSGIGTVDVCISVSYKSINRKGWGYKCKFGSNDQSWSLICSPSSYTFCQNNKQTELSAVSSSRKIGVYVDHKIGILSFYSVSDTMTLIHRVQTTFTQPLYPGFWINLSFASRLFGLAKYPTVKLCDKI